MHNTSLEYLGHGPVSRSRVQGQGHGSKKRGRAQVCAPIRHSLMLYFCRCKALRQLELGSSATYRSTTTAVLTTTYWNDIAYH